MASLRVGFVGCGLIARAHAISLSALARAGIADVEIAVAFDSDTGRADAFTRSFDAIGVSGPDEVAARSDAVYVCSSTRGHLGGVAAAARALRPVFCEKPLGCSLDEALTVAQAARRADLPVQVGLVLRTAPVFRTLAELVASGRFGRPMAVLVRDDQFLPVQGHYASSWRADVEEAGAGVLLEHSIHDIDILQACFGAVSLAVATRRSLAGYPGIEDVASALLQTESGLPMSLVTVWHQVLSRPSTRRYEVLFEHAFLSFDDDFTGPLRVQTSEAGEDLSCPPPQWLLELPLPGGERGLAVRPYVEENRAFVEAVVEGGTPSPGLDDALAAHRVVDACYRSARGGAVPVIPSR